MNDIWSGRAAAGYGLPNAHAPRQPTFSGGCSSERYWQFCFSSWRAY